jgi:outer membrane protein TolC
MRMAAAGAALCILFFVFPDNARSQAQPVSLTEAYALAQKASDAIQLKMLALQKSRLAVQEASSRAWPHVDLQASGSYLTNPPQGYTVKAGDLGSISPAIPAHTPGLNNPVPIPLGPAISIPPNDFTIGAQKASVVSLTASLSQPLFTWGKIRNAIDAAALEVDAAGTDLLVQRRDIDRQVHRAYFGALLAQESVKVLRRLKDTAAAIAADRQASFDQGTVTREAVLQAKSDLASVEARLAEAEQSDATARESLGMLTELDPSVITLATGFSAALPAIDETALRARALEASTDMAALRTQAGLAQKKLAIEEGSSLLLPDVSLGVTFNVTGQEDSWDVTKWDWTGSSWSYDVIISVGLKMSVFDGLASSARIGQARKDTELAAAGLSQAEKLVRLGMRSAIDAAVKADAAVGQRQAAADYAAERLKNARVSFDNGVASQDDARGAEILSGSADLDLLFALYTREEALADIERMTGQRMPENP